MLRDKYWSVNQFVEVDFKYGKFIEISASTTEPVTTSTSEKPKSGMVEHFIKMCLKLALTVLTF